MFSFIKEILNSPDHDRIFNYDESEYEEIKNTDEGIQLNLSYDELLTLHYLIVDRMKRVASRDMGQLTDYLDALNKINKKIIERWNHGQEVRK
ncbi:hypothetical protein [uncultured Anaerococcus sp.]|uniref:hypothetical protein n=1 Tax=uncultured Anaerococcus sp. TaxID=293428 RepID=UPI002804CA71|nr:hypothetical protein [uncultured Anaerococcus sp.]